MPKVLMQAKEVLGSNGLNPRYHTSLCFLLKKILPKLTSKKRDISRSAIKYGRRTEKTEK
jgi:hypothetical protein